MHWTLTDTGWAKAAWGLLFPPLLTGCAVVLFDGVGFDPTLHLNLITKLKVTTFCAPPTVYRMFAQMDLTKFDLSSVRRSVGAGEPLNPEVIKYWRTNTGTTIAGDDAPATLHGAQCDSQVQCRCCTTARSCNFFLFVVTPQTDTDRRSL